MKTNICISIILFASSTLLCMDNRNTEKAGSVKPRLARETTRNDSFPQVIVKKKPINLKAISKKINTEQLEQTGINTTKETVDINLAIDPAEEYIYGARKGTLYIWIRKKLREENGIPKGLHDHAQVTNVVEPHENDINKIKSTVKSIEPFMPLDLARDKKKLIVASAINALTNKNEKKAQLLFRTMHNLKERERWFDHHIKSIALNGDGSKIAIIPIKQKIIKIFNRKLDSLHTINASRSLTAPITSVTFSPNGKMLIAGTENGIMYLHDASKQTSSKNNQSKPTVTIDSGEKDIQNIIYAKDGNLVSISHEAIKIWKLDGHLSKKLKEYYHYDTDIGRVEKKYEKATASTEVSTTAHWSSNKRIPIDLLSKIIVNEPNKRYMLRSKKLKETVLTKVKEDGADEYTTFEKGHFTTIKLLHKQNGYFMLIALGTDCQMHYWEFTSFPFSSEKDPKKHNSTGSLEDSRHEASEPNTIQVEHEPIALDMTKKTVNIIKNSSSSDSDSNSNEEKLEEFCNELDELSKEPPITHDKSPVHSTRNISTPPVPTISHRQESLQNTPSPTPSVTNPLENARKNNKQEEKSSPARDNSQKNDTPPKPSRSAPPLSPQDMKSSSSSSESSYEKKEKHSSHKKHESRENSNVRRHKSALNRLTRTPRPEVKTPRNRIKDPRRTESSPVVKKKIKRKGTFKQSFFNLFKKKKKDKKEKEPTIPRKKT